MGGSEDNVLQSETDRLEFLRAYRLAADDSHIEDLIEDSLPDFLGSDAESEEEKYNGSAICGWRDFAYVGRYYGSDESLTHNRARFDTQLRDNYEGGDSEELDDEYEEMSDEEIDGSHFDGHRYRAIHTLATLNQKLDIVIEGLFSVEYYEHATFVIDTVLGFLKKPDVAITASTYDALSAILNYVNELPYEEPEQFGIEPRRRVLERPQTEWERRELLHEESEYLDRVIQHDELRAQEPRSTKPYTTHDLFRSWKCAHNKLEEELRQIEAEGGPKRVRASSLPLPTHLHFRRLFEEQQRDRYHGD